MGSRSIFLDEMKIRVKSISSHSDRFLSLPDVPKYLGQIISKYGSRGLYDRKAYKSALRNEHAIKYIILHQSMGET